jgi:hypothetical protein
MTTLRYRAAVINETNKALCCHLNDDHVAHWIPRSQLQPGSEIQRQGDSGLLVVTNWFAQQVRLPQGEIMSNSYPDTGSLFKNHDKKTDKHPDYTGQLDFTCTHCGKVSSRRLAAWIKTARAGAKFFSLSFKPAPQETARGGRQQFRQRVEEIGTPLDDDDMDRAFGPAPADDEDLPW